MHKTTCGPLCDRVLDLLGRTHIPAFYAGLAAGAAEKIWLGACRAAMFRPHGPTGEHAPEVGSLLPGIAAIYELYLVHLDTRRGREWWLCGDAETVDAVASLAEVEEDSPEWHILRGRLCGVPPERIDPEFHRRYGP